MVVSICRIKYGNMSSIPVDLEKVKERLFVFADSKDLEENISLSLVVNPEIIKILLDHSASAPKHQKYQLLEQLSLLFQANPNNSLILAKRDSEIEEHNISILDDIIAYTLDSLPQQGEISKLGELLLPFLRLYPIDSRNIMRVTTSLSRMYYEGNFLPTRMALAIRILKVIFQSQVPQKGQPSSYFYLYGQGSGIRMLHEKTLWPFSKGFSLSVSFSLCPNQRPSTLFLIRARGQEFYVGIRQDFTLTVKVFGDTEELDLVTLVPNRWYYLGLEYTLKSRLFNKVFDLKVQLDERAFQKEGLNVPQIGQNDYLEQIVFGQDLHGKINTIFLHRQQHLKDQDQSQFWTSDWESLEGMFKADKGMFDSLYLVYVPYIQTGVDNRTIVYDISSRNHAELLQNTTTYQNKLVFKDINYYGGLYNLLPLFQLLKYFDPKSYPDMLRDILELFLSIFKTKLKGLQEQVVNCQLFSIMGAQLAQINQQFLSSSSLQLLFMLKQEIKEIQLKEQFFRDLVWRFNIREIASVQVIKGLCKFIGVMYDLNPKFYSGIFGVTNIMHFIVQQYQPLDRNKCCANHYILSRNTDDVIPLGGEVVRTARDRKGSDFDSFPENYTDRRIDPFIVLVVQLIQGLMQTQQTSGIQSIRHIMQFAVTSHSLCFTKFTLNIISGVLKTPRLNKKELVSSGALEYIYCTLESAYHHEIVAGVIGILQVLLRSCQDAQDKNKIIFAIKNCIKKLPNEAMTRNQSQTIETSVSEEGLIRRGSIGTSKKQLDYILSITHLKKQNHSNWKPLLEAVLSIVFSNGECSLNDDAIDVLEAYFSVANSHFKRILVKFIFCQIYEADIPTKQNMRVQYFSTFKFLIRIMLEVKLGNESEQYNSEIQKLVVDSLVSLIVPVLDNRAKVYWFLLKIEAILAIVNKELQYVFNQQATKFLAQDLLRLLFTKILQKEECALAQGLQNVGFYLYGVIFCSQESQNPVRIFSYFKTLEKEFWIVGRDQVPQQIAGEHKSQQLIFMDTNLIRSLLRKLPLTMFNFNSNHLNRVSYLLDPKTTEELSVLRSAYLQQIAQMKTKGPQSQTFFDFFETLLSATLIDQNQTPQERSVRTLSNKNVCLIEVLLIMSQVCVEYYLRQGMYDQFVEYLSLSQTILISYVFSMVNTGEPTKNIKVQQNNLTKKVLLMWFHFIYNVMDNEEDIKFNERVEESIREVFLTLFVAIGVLNEKMGALETFRDCLHYGGVMSNMDIYNLYLFQFFDRHTMTVIKKPIASLQQIKQYISMDSEAQKDQVISELYKDVFKRSGYMLKLLQYQVVRELVEVKSWYRNKLNDQIMNCNLHMARENFARQLSVQAESLKSREQQKFRSSQMQFMKVINHQYRTSMYSWGKIWKRLRKYHYPWSNWMNQRQSSEEWNWDANAHKNPFIKFKCSKCFATNGSRPILEVKLLEPWHVKKIATEREIQYMTKDYHYNFYNKQKENKSSRPKNFITNLFNKNLSSQEDEFNVEWIINNQKRKGILKITLDKIQFVFTSIYQKDSHVDFTHFRLGQFKPLVKTWNLVLISNAIRRRYLSYHECLLISLQNNTQLIFNFTDKNLDGFLSLLTKKQKSKPDQRPFLKLNNIRFYTERFDYQMAESDLTKAKFEQWNTRQIGNLQYLLALNRLGGRSFYDPTQYPVMPWILSNYSSQEIVLRPLNKTMGALGNQNRRAALYEKSKIQDPFNPVPSYQYGTHYSSPGVVFNYLIRLSPFTQAGRTLQGGKFDIADRVFFSLHWAWRSATSQMSDVRELTPEFYYLPEFLLNLEFHNFGLTQAKERVHNVELPPWAKGDPYKFVQSHRKVLEGEDVSLNINQWIDFIFGYKQKGKQAEQSLNLYYYLTYQNSVDLESIQDPVMRTSMQAQIVHFGQTPHQLFDKPHPRRDVTTKTFSKFPTQFQSKAYTPKRMVSEPWQTVSLYSKGCEPILTICQTDGRISVVKCNNVLQYSYEQGEFGFLSEKFLNLKKTKNEIHLMDINFQNKIAIFRKRFIVTGFSLNGQLRIYNTDGKLLETQHGEPKNCIYVNQRENLLMTGSKDGLFQVYEIIYQDQGQLSLVPISSEQCYYSINHISQGFGFYSVCSGKTISIYNINRSAVFVDRKSKRVRCKFIRSFRTKRKATYSAIVSSPVFSVVFYDNTQLWSYSINGQLLTNRPIVLKLNPIVYTDEDHTDHLLCLQDSKLLILSTPYLQTTKFIHLPPKEYTCWDLHNRNIILGTSSGELIVVNRALFN